MTREAPNLAVLIDSDNAQAAVISDLLAEIAQVGTATVKRAYGDWTQWGEYKRPLEEHAIELIEMPGSKLTGKNSADIKMVVDALELSYTKPHIDACALISGDSDFSPLVSKLRENNKHTIGIGVKRSTSPLLVDNCDEFLYYDDLVRAAKPKAAGAADRKKPKSKKDEAVDFFASMPSIASAAARSAEYWTSVMPNSCLL